MPFSSKRFSIVRVTDEEVHRCVLLIAKALSAEVTSVEVHTLLTKHNQPNTFTVDIPFKEVIRDDTKKVFETYLSAKGHLLYTMTYKFRDITLSMTRPQEGHNLKPGPDSIVIEFTHDTLERALFQIELVNKHFTIDTVSNLPKSIAQDLQQYYAARENSVLRLESQLSSLTNQIAEYKIKVEDELKQERADLAKEERSLKTQLDTDRTRLQGEYSLKTKDLEDQRKQIEAQARIYDRRALSESFKTELKDMAKDVQLKPSTVAKRRSVRITYIIGMLILCVGYLASYIINYYNDTSYNWVTVLSQFFTGISLLGLFTFVIRWEIQWFKSHADDEYRLKKMLLDTARASWIVELALEWHVRTQDKEMPKELLDRLTAHLYDANMDGIDLSPIESIRSGLGDNVKLIVSKDSVTAEGTTNGSKPKK